MIKRYLNQDSLVYKALMPMIKSASISEDNFFGPQKFLFKRKDGTIGEGTRYGYESNKKLYDVTFYEGEKHYFANSKPCEKTKYHNLIETQFGI